VCRQPFGDEDDGEGIGRGPEDRAREIDAAGREGVADEVAVVIARNGPDVRSLETKRGAGRQRRPDLAARRPFVAADAQLGQRAVRDRVFGQPVDEIDRIRTDTDDVEEGIRAQGL